MSAVLDSFSPIDSLNDQRRNIQSIPNGSWTMSAGTLRPRRGVIEHRSGWVSLEVPWRRIDRGGLFAVVLDASARNATLPPGWKLAFDSDESMIVLRSEIACDENASPAFRDRMPSHLQVLDETLDALDAGDAEPTTHFQSGEPLPPVELSETERAFLTHLADETGWPYHIRATGRLAIPLDVPGLFCEALVSPVAAEGVEGTIECGANDLTETSALAMAVLTLRANRFFRMTRLATTYDSQTDSRSFHAKGCWDVVIPGPASASALLAALTALSFACRGAMREWQALQDERTARAYLEVSGMFPGLIGVPSD